MTDNDTSSIRLDGELTIYRAQEIRQALRDALAAAGPSLTIDLSAVTDIDSAGVQLLMAARRQALDEGRTLALVEHGPAVVDAFALFDLAAWFGDPIVEPVGR
ncbi:MAG: STAS domain-containing protein [Burkholderiaceae bacterium]